MMRQTLEVEETVLNQVLYVGNMHDDAPAGEVFMFFREKVSEAEADPWDVKLAIINPDCANEGSRQIQNNCQITAIESGCVLADHLTAMND